MFRIRPVEEEEEEEEEEKKAISPILPLTTQVREEWIVSMYKVVTSVCLFVCSYLEPLERFASNLDLDTGMFLVWFKSFKLRRSTFVEKT